MSKSKAELASDLLSAFMGEIHEITLSGGDVSLERKQSMKHLLAMKEQMERMFLLVDDVERSGSTLPFKGADCVDASGIKDASDEKFVTSHSSKIENCIEKLSSAFELLATKGSRPIVGTSTAIQPC